MLAPDDRTLLLDALRPPEGYAFDQGVGTTFTLDLVTMLVAPLSLALHDVASASEALNDPVLLMDGIRRYAKQLTLFCQAGYIAVPRQANPLYRYLEEMVVEVNAPNGGLFHPKVWLLRYTSQSDRPLYRFLCLSRNMDFSRSWELILRVEGEVQNRKVGYGRNAPLSEFLAALPKFSVRRASERVLGTIELLRQEVRRVRFRVPDPFFEDSLEFLPLGHRSHLRFRLDQPKGRSMVVSPFLSDQVLKESTLDGEGHVLLSEPESLRRVDPRFVARFTTVYVFNEAARNPTAEGKLEEGEQNAGGEIQAADPSRLHAKLFIFEEGWDARWLIGSANATTPALNGHNVEFLVGLKGRKSQVGIDKLLGDEEDTFSLRALLAEYRPDDEREDADPDVRKAEEQLEKVRVHLVERHFGVRVRSEEEGEYALHLAPRRKALTIPDGEIELSIWPVTLREDRAQILELADLAEGLTFEGVSLLALTSFFAFHVQVRVGRLRRAIRFVLNLPISGMPKNRDDHIIRAILTDRGQFLRYLRFLLAEELGWLPGLEAGAAKEGSFGWKGRALEDMDIPLFEDLARALSRSPGKIDQISELVERLRGTQEGREILPEGFDALWEAIREAKEQVS